jgi:hypothetical protein
MRASRASAGLDTNRCARNEIERIAGMAGNDPAQVNARGTRNAWRQARGSRRACLGSEWFDMLSRVFLATYRMSAFVRGRASAHEPPS